MDRKAFKLRMQNLKSYRDNNPGKGYWDWRNSLPDNLKYTDDTEYDMYWAYKSGVLPEYIEEDNSYHLPTRDPNTGKILKKSIHPTFWKGLAEDAKLGYDAYFVGDEVYTKNKYEGPILAFADGGEVPPKRRGGYDKLGNIVVPVTNENGILNITTPLVTITPKDNIDLSTSIDRGRRVVGDIGREVLSNTTPFGDIESAVYAYDAIKNRDWLGMGLAAATMLPFVPSSVGRSRKISKLPKRDIPTVHKNLTLDKLNEVFKKEVLLPEVTIYDKSDVANAVNRVVESLDKSAYKRARKVDSQYGTNYAGAYDELRKNYDDMSLFEVIADKNLDRDYRGAVGKTKLNDEALFSLAVEGNPIDDIRRYEIAAKPGEATEAVVHHEMSHIANLMQLKDYNMSNIHNNKLLKALADDNNFLDDRTLLIIFPGIDILKFKNYQRTGSELKSFMNLTRRSMEQKGIIKRLTDTIDEKQINKYMDSKPFSSSENVIYRSFKDPQIYLKWMNTIPIVGLAPAAVNRFYNNNSNL